MSKTIDFDLTRGLVQTSCQMVFMEFIWRMYYHSNEFWVNGCLAFFISYVLCIATEFFGLKDNVVVKSTMFKSILTVLHGMDGLAAFIIGLGLRMKSISILTVGILIITKCFLIHLLNRMILAHKKGEVTSLIDGFTQTSKSFLHHVASFLFLSQPTEILLTTVWRTLSMSGHAMLVLRGRVSPSALQSLSWTLAYLRNVFLFTLLCICVVYPSIRGEFAASAVGHIAYMAVRLGPVFKQGGAYLSAAEKEEWACLSDVEKIQTLLSGRHAWLGVELALLFIATMFFAALRLQLLVTELCSGALSINGSNAGLLRVQPVGEGFVQVGSPLSMLVAALHSVVSGAGLGHAVE